MTPPSIARSDSMQMRHDILDRLHDHLVGMQRDMEAEGGESLPGIAVLAAEAEADQQRLSIQPMKPRAAPGKTPLLLGAKVARRGGR